MLIVWSVWMKIAKASCTCLCIHCTQMSLTIFHVYIIHTLTHCIDNSRNLYTSVKLPKGSSQKNTMNTHKMNSGHKLAWAALARVWIDNQIFISRNFWWLARVIISYRYLAKQIITHVTRIYLFFLMWFIFWIFKWQYGGGANWFK